MIDYDASFRYSTYDDISLTSLDPLLSVISPSQSQSQSPSSLSSSSSTKSPTYSSMVDSKLMTKKRLVGLKKSFEGRKTANARERARMRVLSKAFSKLKSSLPWAPIDTKLTKLDILRLALRYINHLALQLRDSQDQTAASNEVSDRSTSIDWSAIQQYESYQCQIKAESTSIKQTASCSSSASSSTNIGWNVGNFEYNFYRPCDPNFVPKIDRQLLNHSI